MITDDYLPLAFGDSTLIEKLYNILATNEINSEVAQNIKADLIKTLYSEINLGSLKQLHSISQKCVACVDMNHDATLPKWNKESPKILFVMSAPDSLSSDGKELFVSSLVKNGYNVDECGTTFVTRCTKKGEITNDEVETCSSKYLFTEIQLMKPQLIVTLGAVPTKALLGPKIKVTELSKNPTPIWLGPWMILPCISPNQAARADTNLQDEFRLIIKKAKSLV